MESLEAELARARALDVGEIADAVAAIGFECTRCGGCCKGYDPDPDSDPDPDPGSERAAGGGTDDREPHTATVFPDEIRRLQSAAGDENGARDGLDSRTGTGAGDGDGDGDGREYDWRDVARPMPYGLRETDDGPVGETFEWALQTDDCGNCTFYQETDGVGACTVHDDRPLICRTYPFSLALGGTAEPMGGVVDREGSIRAHECEGLGREIPRADAEELAAALKRRAIRELEEAIAVRERYEPTDADGVVVHDSEGAKRPDGTPLDRSA